MPSDVEHIMDPHAPQQRSRHSDEQQYQSRKYDRPNQSHGLHKAAAEVNIHPC